MSGQAETAPGSLDDLASFLEDKPLEASDEQEDDATPQEDSQEQTEEDETAVDESEAEASEEEAEDQPSVVFKVTVKGEDGADQTLEVDQKELIAGYQRQRDYTVKTQALAERERQAFEVVTQEIEKSRAHYMQQAQMAHMAVRELAGLRSAEEMAVLAQTDPLCGCRSNSEPQRCKAACRCCSKACNQSRHKPSRCRPSSASSCSPRRGMCCKKRASTNPNLQGFIRKRPSGTALENKSSPTSTTHGSSWPCAMQSPIGHCTTRNRQYSRKRKPRPSCLQPNNP